MPKPPNPQTSKPPNFQTPKLPNLYNAFTFKLQNETVESE